MKLGNMFRNKCIVGLLVSVPVDEVNEQQQQHQQETDDDENRQFIRFRDSFDSDDDDGISLSDDSSEFVVAVQEEEEEEEEEETEDSDEDEDNSDDDDDGGFATDSIKLAEKRGIHHSLSGWAAREQRRRRREERESLSTPLNVTFTTRTVVIPPFTVPLNDVVTTTDPCTSPRRSTTRRTKPRHPENYNDDDEFAVDSIDLARQHLPTRSGRRSRLQEREQQEQDDVVVVEPGSTFTMSLRFDDDDSDFDDDDCDDDTATATIDDDDDDEMIHHQPSLPPSTIQVPVPMIPSSPSSPATTCILSPIPSPTLQGFKNKLPHSPSGQPALDIATMKPVRVSNRAA